MTDIHTARSLATTQEQAHGLTPPQGRSQSRRRTKSPHTHLTWQVTLSAHTYMSPFSSPSSLSCKHTHTHTHTHTRLNTRTRIIARFSGGCHYSCTYIQMNSPEPQTKASHNPPGE